MCRFIKKICRGLKNFVADNIGKIIVLIIVVSFYSALNYPPKNVVYETKEQLETVLFKDWKTGSDGQKVLETSIKVSSYEFERETSEAMVAQRLEAYNNRVKSRKANRANGFVVRPDNEFVETRLEAVYSSTIRKDGKSGHRIWIFSENSSSAQYFRAKGKKIHLKN